MVIKIDGAMNSYKKAVRIAPILEVDVVLVLDGTHDVVNSTEDVPMWLDKTLKAEVFNKIEPKTYSAPS